jgi:hypothetical protein
MQQWQHTCASTKTFSFATPLTCLLLRADAAVAALGSKEAENKAFALASLEGQGPGNDRAKWGQLFATAQP